MKRTSFIILLVITVTSLGVLLMRSDFKQGILPEKRDWEYFLDTSGELHFPPESPPSDDFDNFVDEYFEFTNQLTEWLKNRGYVDEMDDSDEGEFYISSESPQDRWVLIEVSSPKFLDTALYQHLRQLIYSHDKEYKITISGHLRGGSIPEGMGIALYEVRITKDSIEYACAYLDPTNDIWVDCSEIEKFLFNSTQ